MEASSGIVLLTAAALALLWANGPWAASYEGFWTTPVGIEVGGFSFTRDLRWFVNDGLMTVFFFVVGLEIRREIHDGELSVLRRAALPVVAAVGGMVLPAVIYALFNAGHASAHGWGVPMATDIAFAVGVLALLGSRVSPAVRILLLALAVIDDLGAILVIAAFYSHGVDVLWLATAGLALLLVVILQMFGIRATTVYVALGGAAWAATYASGIHPTIAGVALGLLTPAQAWLGPERLAESAEDAARGVRRALESDTPDLQGNLDLLVLATREAVSPAERLQHQLHSLVAWGIMPLFALVNAGVSVGAVTPTDDAWRIFGGVVAGLVVGKGVGIFGLVRVASALGLVDRPRGVRWADVGVVGVVGGIGFTMALFIAQLAFSPGPMLETAKLGILVGSAVAGIAGLVFGRFALGERLDADAARTAREAESSTEA